MKETILTPRPSQLPATIAEVTRRCMRALDHLPTDDERRRVICALLALYEKYGSGQ
jgi:hypothetical protein